MKRSWQHVAERADNRAFAVDEISTAMIPALERDCRDEMSSEFVDHIRRVFEEQEALLIRDDVKARVEGLRREAGCGIGQKLLENVAQISAGDAPGVLELLKAMTAALADRAARCSRQAEEHYLRKSTASRANNVRARFEQGIAGAALEALARQILKLDARSPARSTLKRAGLDDGVSLR
jgi:hypothetical protein